MSETSPPADPGLPTVREFWAGQADRYDDEVDHGLSDASAREAWRARLSD
jgi:hypothetical protein